MGKEKIGYLGQEGTFSWQAAQIVAGKKEKDIIPFSSFWEGMQLLVERELNKIILPIENSTGGGIGKVISLLREMPEDLRIEREVKLLIEQYLLGLEGSEASDIKEVFSMGEVFAQCQELLNKRKFSCLAVESTVKAAQLVVKKNDKRTAVIGAKWLSKFFPELEVITKINDNSSNTTRFILMGREDIVITGNDKTSIIFGVHDKVGTLVEALEVLREADINITMIMSMPTGEKLGDYDFFIDIEGHKKEKEIKNALATMRKKTTFLRVLGSYPSYYY